MTTRASEKCENLSLESEVTEPVFADRFDENIHKFSELPTVDQKIGEPVKQADITEFLEVLEPTEAETLIIKTDLKSDTQKLEEPTLTQEEARKKTLDAQRNDLNNIIRFTEDSRFLAAPARIGIEWENKTPISTDLQSQTEGEFEIEYANLIANGCGYFMSIILFFILRKELRSRNALNPLYRGIKTCCAGGQSFGMALSNGMTNLPIMPAAFSDGMQKFWSNIMADLFCITFLIPAVAYWYIREKIFDIKPSDKDVKLSRLLLVGTVDGYTKISKMGLVIGNQAGILIGAMIGWITHNLTTTLVNGWNGLIGAGALVLSSALVYVVNKFGKRRWVHKENYPCLTLSDDSEINLAEIAALSKKNNDQPVIIKKDQEIFIYGFTYLNEWNITKLHAENCTGLTFPEAGQEPLSQNLTEETYLEIAVKKAHIHNKDTFRTNYVRTGIALGIALGSCIGALVGTLLFPGAGTMLGLMIGGAIGATVLGPIIGHQGNNISDSLRVKFNIPKNTDNSWDFTTRNISIWVGMGCTALGAAFTFFFPIHGLVGYASILAGAAIGNAIGSLIGWGGGLAAIKIARTIEPKEVLVQTLDKPRLPWTQYLITGAQHLYLLGLGIGFGAGFALGGPFGAILGAVIVGGTFGFIGGIIGTLITRYTNHKKDVESNAPLTTELPIPQKEKSAPIPEPTLQRSSTYNSLSVLTGEPSEQEEVSLTIPSTATTASNPSSRSVSPLQRSRSMSSFSSLATLFSNSVDSDNFTPTKTEPLPKSFTFA